MRNNGAGYGMNGLKLFNLLYGLKKLEENNLVELCKLPDTCKFSYLLKFRTLNLIYGQVGTGILCHLLVSTQI